MNYLHQTDQEDPLDIDKAGYYEARGIELFLGMELEVLDGSIWRQTTFDLNFNMDDLASGYSRVRWLQAKDIMDLGFPRLAQGIPMYQRGSYTISAYRLLDPTTSRLLISQNGIRVFEGHVKNKSELRRLLILNEIPFADSN